MTHRLFAYALGATLLAATPTARAQVQTIKLATLAPEGSAWMKFMHEWASTIEQRAGGRLKVKFYAGGVAGDERDFVRKIRLGQLNAAAITGMGLGLVQPEIRVFELPLMFRDHEEMDQIRSALDGEIRKKFEEKGYILVGWGDLGPVHLFSNIPLKSKNDLLQMKLWGWVDDPMVRTLFQTMGIAGVPLGVPDVQPSLQTGLINACYGSPSSVLGLQWSTRVKYISSMAITQSIGAIVIQKKVWDALPADVQTAITEESRQLNDRLRKQVRDENTQALKKMQSLGLAVVPTPPAMIAEFQTQSKEVWKKLAGQLYSKAFLDQVIQLTAQKRGGK